MFEPKQGTHRIISALETAAAFPTDLQKLADILNYVPSQLAEDIRALSDFYEAARANEEGDNDD